MTDQLAQIVREQRAGQVIIHLSGEIDLSNADDLQARIERLVDNCPHVVVDLTGIRYIDSQGLRLLNRLAIGLAANGAAFELVAPPESVARDVLDLTRMSADIPVLDVLPA
jgi:anti-sigma B factor antagonist